MIIGSRELTKTTDCGLPVAVNDESVTRRSDATRIPSYVDKTDESFRSLSRLLICPNGSLLRSPPDSAQRTPSESHDTVPKAELIVVVDSAYRQIQSQPPGPSELTILVLLRARVPDGDRILTAGVPDSDSILTAGR